MRKDKGKVVTLEKETITEDKDGNIQKRVQEFTRLVERDKFIQVYLEDMRHLFRIDNKCDIKVLMSIWNKTQYATNKIILIKSIKEEIAKETGYSYQSIRNSISRLNKLGMLLRHDTSIYYLNPKFFFKGTIKDRKNCCEVLIRYKLI